MRQPVTYIHKEKYKLKNTVLERFQSIITSHCNEVISSSLINSNDAENRSIRFHVKDDVFNKDVDLEIIFKLSSNEIYEVTTTILSEEDELNEIHLKHYTADLISKAIRDEYNEETTKYTIRTYSRLFNSHPIREEILINGDFKVLIKPHLWTSKEEPLTEQIIMYDIELVAINIEHARSLAYNHTMDLNAYLSVLLDVGFEVLTSEFRIFTIKKDTDFWVKRHRTGFIDYELGVLVKDNHTGLKDILDIEHINSFHSGKEGITLLMENEDGSLRIGEPYIYNTFSNNEFLENLFKNHKIKKSKTKNKSKPNFIPINRKPHYPNAEIKIPTNIRKYFKSISNLNSTKKNAFTACARMYNIALNGGRQVPTLEKSYKVCAIEALAKGDGENFSSFMSQYSGNDFDKNISDFFYSVRSGHFHSGKFYFNEYEMSLFSEVDFSLKLKTDDFIRFDNYLRTALINWVNRRLIG